MAFVDEARIFVKAGSGGKGCESSHVDRSNRHPRPDGGDGGKGGDIIFVSDSRIQTLLDYRFKQHYKASKGGHGGSRNKKGKVGENCILRVPQGTILKDFDEGLIIQDLVADGQSVIVARGGQGGRGNANKKTPLPPGPGEERTVHLELKIIADVGIVGFPNAGKSTFICAVSKVKSKVANYPFTTKQPVLGIVEGDYDIDSFVIADLPGLIEGAHQGKGLGDRFLKHAERTRILMHMVDMSAEEGRDPYEDYMKISHELEQYSQDLSIKHKLVVANKMDVPSAISNLQNFKRRYNGELFEVSSLKKEGLDKVINKIRELLCKESFQEKSGA